MEYMVLLGPKRRSAEGPARDIRFRGHPPLGSELPSTEVVSGSSEELSDALSDMARDREVWDAWPMMPTQLIKPFDAAADGDSGDSWGIAAVQADKSEFTGAGTRVAVLDTGIDRAHPAFEGVHIREADFSGCGNGDNNGHGTHCAGTIFGRDVDGSRIGVARGVKQALIGKILGDGGRGTAKAAFDGLIWAMNEGAMVISMSIGFNFPGMVSVLIAEGLEPDLATSQALVAYGRSVRWFDTLMDMAKRRQDLGPGCVVVAAAGNESKRHIRSDYEIAASLPAAAEGVLSTGALARSPDGYTIAPYSNTFPELCAPGTGIKSAVPGGGLGIKDGTSMACPHVAGVAALWWQAVHDERLRAKADTVTRRIHASCRIDGLAPSVNLAARGSGLVTAP
jgi:subtilisin family serine protease